jgi:IMP dehydrogenase/GMP reductase
LSKAIAARQRIPIPLTSPAPCGANGRLRRQELRMIKTRITELLGIEYPIVQAPMGWIARAQLASAVSNAGGLGIIETSSGRLDEVREEVKKMRTLTTKPFGVNIA